jgi:hypothetical protein
MLAWGMGGKALDQPRIRVFELLVRLMGWNRWFFSSNDFQKPLV